MQKLLMAIFLQVLEHRSRIEEWKLYHAHLLAPNAITTSCIGATVIKEELDR